MRRLFSNVLNFIEGIVQGFKQKPKPRDTFNTESFLTGVTEYNDSVVKAADPVHNQYPELIAEIDKYLKANDKRGGNNMTNTFVNKHLLNYDDIKKAVENKGYAFFDGHWDVNIIGIRNQFDKHSNSFNDLICLVFKENDEKHCFKFKATTDPGIFYRVNSINDNGTAIVKPDQYRGVWQIGKHQGKYEALVQARPITVYRDNNSDEKLDTEGMQEDSGFHGINLHRANEITESTQVDRWSAGCQVISDPNNFEILLATVKKSMAIYGDTVSYTLLNSTDLSG